MSRKYLMVTLHKAAIEVEDQNIVDAMIEGTRLSVFQIADYHYYAGHTVDYIADAFDSSMSQVFMALAFYHEHKQLFDEAIIELHADEEGFDGPIA